MDKFSLKKNLQHYLVLHLLSFLRWDIIGNKYKVLVVGADLLKILVFIKGKLIAIGG